MKGPIEKLSYVANMKRFVGMVAGGTGITPMLQVIQEIVRNPADNTAISLVFANQTTEDILLKSKLDELAAIHGNFSVTYIVDEPTLPWDGLTGRISTEVVKRFLPEPSSETLLMVCGPPGFMNAVSGDKNADKTQGVVAGILKELHYTGKCYFHFLILFTSIQSDFDFVHFILTTEDMVFKF